MVFGETEKTVLTRLFQTRLEIIVAYLFGSQARGRTGFASDIDLAVLVEPSQIDEKNYPFGYQAELLTDLIKALKCNEVDLVILNQAPPLLKFQVIYHGDVLFSRSESQRIAFHVKAFNEYQDIRPLLAVQYAAFKKRLEKIILEENPKW